LRPRSLLVTQGLLAFVLLAGAGQGCASCAGAGQRLLSISPGILNDPSNRKLRHDILQFGMDQFCHQMQTHDAPLAMAPEAPVIGRFFVTSCSQQELQNEDWFIQFSGYGYGWTNLSRKLTFSMAGAVDYMADFQMSGSTMYIYFRPRQVTSSSFQSHVIEQPVASFLNSMSNLGDTFGKQLVGAQLNQGFTVIRDSDGGVDFAVGLVEVGKRPTHSLAVKSEGRVIWEQARVEVHQNERDFVGPIEVTDSGKAIYVTAQMGGVQAIDLLLLRKDVGDASVRLYYDYPQAGPLSGPPIASDIIQANVAFEHGLPVDPGQYYLVLDNTPTAGTVAPPNNPLDDRFATVSYAVQIGDAP
jgi:hypothetical protein